MLGRIKRVAIGALALSLAVTPSLVSACGGFFGSADLTIDLNAFRVAFSVGKDQMITEVVGVDYTGKAADFSWVMPLPATPTVGVADQSAFDALQSATDPTVTYPVDYCAGMNVIPLGLGGGGGDGAIGTVGPYDYAIIKNDSPGELVKWLRDHGYTIRAGDVPTINQYVKEGNTFVALRLKPGADVQDIQPVVFKYQSNKITIPVRMGAVASSANVPILAWIFSDTQYAPTNFKRVDRPSLSDTRAINELYAMGSLSPPRDSNPPDIVYAAGVKAIQAKYKGQAFITEYAGPTKDLKATTKDPVVQGMLTAFPYVTRLHAQLSPDQMIADPLFAPIASGVDVPAVIDLGKIVDPLKLYGCLTSEAITPRLVAEFASSHTTFEPLRFDVGHPTNWKLSQFSIAADPSAIYPMGGSLIYAFSPEPVTAKTIDTYFKGGATPPMFVFTEMYFSEPGAIYQALPDFSAGYPYDQLLLQALGRDPKKDKISPLKNGGAADASFWPYSAANGDTLILSGILASKAQWQSNQNLFNDMLDYANGYQYFTGADTKDTLFLKVRTAAFDTIGDIYELPIPNGWTAQFDSKSDIVIAADQSSDNGPAMRLTLVSGTTSNYDGLPYGSDVYAWDKSLKDITYPADIIQRAMSFYGVSGSPNDKAITDVLQNCAIDQANGARLQPVPFHSGGRTGLVALTNEYIVGVYAPDADFSKYQATLQKMMDAYVAGYVCGAKDQSDGLGNDNATPGADTTPVTCPNSPPPQLTVDGEGSVTPGEPDNLRAAPTTNSGVLLQIPAGGLFTVLEGPVCDAESGLTWWQIKYRSHIGWLAEGQGKTYFVLPHG